MVQNGVHHNILQVPKNCNSIVLRNDMKDDLTSSLDFFRKNGEFYRGHGQRYKYVTLFTGHPGTGKTTFALAYANQCKCHIYSLNLNKSFSGDLNQLIQDIDTSKGHLLIDDFDHYFNDDNVLENDNDNNDDIDTSSNRDEHNDRKNNKNNKKNKKITYHEFLTVLDGVGSKDGLIVYICMNDPSKVLKTNIQNIALFRERRINKIAIFKLCDHQMITELYVNIFKKRPNTDIIQKIPIDKYAPCLIAQQFISLFEKYGGNIDDREKDIEKILIDLAENNIETNLNIISSYVCELYDGKQY